MKLEDAIKKHRDMWNWISSEILRTKRSHMPNQYISGISDSTAEEIPFNYNYICEYVISNNKKLDCSKCPLQWNDQDTGEFREAFPGIMACAARCNKKAPKLLFYAICAGKDELTPEEALNASKYAKEVADLKEIKEIF